MDHLSRAGLLDHDPDAVRAETALEAFPRHPAAEHPADIRDPVLPPLDVQFFINPAALFPCPVPERETLRIRSAPGDQPARRIGEQTQKDHIKKAVKKFHNNDHTRNTSMKPGHLI